MLNIEKYFNDIEPDEMIEHFKKFACKYQISDVELMNYNKIVARPIFIEKKLDAKISSDVEFVVDFLMNNKERFFYEDNYISKNDYLQNTKKNEIIGRIDFLLEHEQVKILEMNVTSALGGILTNEILGNEGYLEYFIPKLKNEYKIKKSELLKNIFKIACKDDIKKNIAIVDTKKDLEIGLIYFEQLEKLMQKRGYNVRICGLEELICKDKKIYYKDFKIDTIYRCFSWSDFKKSEIYENSLEAVNLGNLNIALSVAYRYFSYKSALAIMSQYADENANSNLEAKRLQSIIPWTRILEENDVLYKGCQMQLTDVLNKYKNEMVLKPIDGRCGKNIFIGSETKRGKWDSVVAENISKRKYIVQKKINMEKFEMPLYNIETESIIKSNMSAVYSIFITGGKADTYYIRMSDASNTIIGNSKGLASCVLVLE